MKNCLKITIKYKSLESADGIFIIYLGYQCLYKGVDQLSILLSGQAVSKIQTELSQWHHVGSPVPEQCEIKVHQSYYFVLLTEI